MITLQLSSKEGEFVFLKKKVVPVPVPVLGSIEIAARSAPTGTALEKSVDAKHWAAVETSGFTSYATNIALDGAEKLAVMTSLSPSEVVESL